MILLVGSVVLIALNIVRFSSSTVASARDGDPSRAHGTVVFEVTDGVARTVKYLVIPAALLLVGGVLVGSSRRDDRVHQLRVDAEND